MSLRKRLDIIAEEFEGGSRSALASALGVAQSTFNGYFSADGQKKIKVELLNRILDCYPNISRSWLFFGEGGMLDEWDGGEENTVATTLDGDIAGDTLFSVLTTIYSNLDEAAKALGISFKALDAHIGRRPAPSWAILKRLAKVGININYILTGSGPITTQFAHSPLAEAVTQVEQAMQGVDEMDVLKAAIAKLESRHAALAKKRGGYGTQLSAREARFHEDPADYPEGSACGIDQDPPTPKCQYVSMTPSNRSKR
jgi:transcriptional regulator with XRE-family HTH domain